MWSHILFLVGYWTACVIYLLSVAVLLRKHVLDGWRDSYARNGEWNWWSVAEPLILTVLLAPVLAPCMAAVLASKIAKLAKKLRNK